MAVSIYANFVAKLSAEQPIDGYVQPLAEHVPESGFNSADGVVNDSCY